MEGNGIPGPVKKEMSHRDMALFLKEYKSSGIGGRNMVTQRTFGTLPSGEEVQIYHLGQRSEEAETALHSPDLHLTVRK